MRDHKTSVFLRIHSLVLSEWFLFIQEIKEGQAVWETIKLLQD